MRHTNLSSAVRQAKKLAKEKSRPHYANGSSGRYKVSDKKPEDSSFVQATPSGGEWSHKMNSATRTFTKSRIFGDATMEAVERDWEGNTMRSLLGRLEEDEGSVEYVSGKLKEMGSELNRIGRDFKAGKKKLAAQGIQDLLGGLKTVIWTGFARKKDDPESAAAEAAQTAINKAQQAVYRMEKAIK